MAYYYGMGSAPSSSWAAAPSSSQAVLAPSSSQAVLPPSSSSTVMAPSSSQTVMAPLSSQAVVQPAMMHPPPPLPPVVRPWSRAEDKVFENALVAYPENMPNRWAFVASQLPGRTIQEVWEHYQALLADVELIERGMVEFPESWDHEDDSARAATGRRRTDDQRRRGVPWSEEEHRLFLEGLNKYGKGDWRNISRWSVKTRTPTQVASHAQKYFLRQSTAATRGDTKRKSIHDITSTSTAGNNNNNTTA